MLVWRELTKLKMSLRERMSGSPLLNHEEFAFEFGAEIKRIWRNQLTARVDESVKDEMTH